MSQAVPDILKQRFIELDGTSRTLIPCTNDKDDRHSQTRFANGSFLLWKGVETGFFYVTGLSSPGSILVFDGRNNKAEPLLEYKFGRTAIIIDVLYFPLANDNPGILVAVADRSIEKGDYVAYISFRSKKLLNSCYLPYPITKLCSITDGTSASEALPKLAKTFNKDWPHIFLVGCRFGYAALLCMDITVDDSEIEFLVDISGSPTKARVQTKQRPSRPKKNVHLSKHVFVSALHWIEKSSLVVIGFNFGGIMVVSLRSSKVYSLLYIDGMVQHFAHQEPEEDPRPLFYMWISFNSLQIGNALVLCTVNFPKDEQATSNSAEYTFLEPCFTPCMKWSPDNCTRLLAMRTIYRSKRRYNQNNSTQRPLSSLSNSFSETQSKNDTSLLFISWIQKTCREEATLHGALFDLNAFYAKRLIAKVQPDATIARQLPFFARFSSLYIGNKMEYIVRNNSILDISVSNVHQFAPPAFLNENLDQLYYPSTYHLELNCLTPTRVFKAKVRPIQTHLIIELAANIFKYFVTPHYSAQWIHAIGLANSAPASDNLNEERACLLRIIVHSFFPSILTLIDSVSNNMDYLKFIQKWVWKEVEVTKMKFDEFCVPLFDSPPHEPSPSARGFIQHARVFFKRASIILEALDAKISKVAGKEKSRTIQVQGKIARQIRLYSSTIAFALVYNLLPVNKFNSKLYEVVIDRFSRFSERARRRGKELKIHSLLEEIIKSNPNEDIWQGKSANGWYPPRDFKCLLPILLLLNVTEKAKLTLLGYYCLDLDAASAVFGSEVQAKDGNTPPTSSLNLTRTFTPTEDNTHPYQNRDYFSLFLSFVLQEDFSLEEMNKIRSFWLEDKNILQMDFYEPVEAEPQNVQDDDQLEFINSLQNIQKTREYYLAKKWGIFLFNNLMLEHRRYKLLMDLPPLKGNEPEFVQKCYSQCMDIRRQLPSLFKKIEPLPAFIMERYRKKVKQSKGPGKFLFQTDLQESQNQPILPLRIKHSPLVDADNLPKIFAKSDGVTSILGKRSLTSRFSVSDEDTEHFEELPLTIATPRKRQRLFLFDSSQGGIGAAPDNEANKTSPVICEDIQKGCVNAKEWDRISKITQTPLSLQRSINQSRLPRGRIGSARNALFRDEGQRSLALQNDGTSTPIRARDQNAEISPEPSIAPVQPPSILKSDNRKSRLPSTSRSEKPKIRFAQSLFTTERIPSRFEKATEEMNNTSFSNFAEFSPSESSPTSSRSGHQPGTESGNSTQIQLKTPQKKTPMTPKKKTTTAKKPSPINSPQNTKILRRSPRRHGK
uniref:ELYS-bb domain-containing protein n=1 Tax=Meloidogyne hapla TaxID=6305 RepID=A0A1I8AZW5_MELHA